MTFREVLAQVIDWLQQDKRVSYRALKREFNIDDDYIGDLKEELIDVRECAIDRDGKMLIWMGESEDIPVTTNYPTPPDPQSVVEPTQTIQATSPPIEPYTADAERRQLTVMFCDLVGSTHLSGQLDPEELRDVIRAYQAVCTDVTQQFEGHVAQHLGDGLLIYFGYPAAHEDDAQRAVRTGLGIIEAMQTLNQGLAQAHGVELAVRIGIHTGLVVIGDIGAGEKQEQLALGETPNVASRIQGRAEPNTVVISHATYLLIEGFFECNTLGKRVLKGVDDPVNVYRVLQESGAQGRLDVATTRGLTPLVGRESEVTLLLDRWQQAENGSGQVVLLSGEAGIGKSRLVHVLKEHVATAPHTRLECRSSTYYQNTALYPITDLMQRTLQWRQEDTADEKLSKLEQALGRYQPVLEEIVPLFTALLSLPLPEDRYAPLNLTPQSQRQKTLEMLVTMFVEESERQPVLFIVEDLHWTDPTTLELLELLIDQSATASIFTLLTCRPEFEPTWSHRTHLAELSLSRLSQSQMERMAESVTHGKRLPSEVVHEIIEKTDGVPLFIEEMTKAVLESGALKEVNGQYEITGSLSSLAIPVTLQDSLMARLDRLVTAKGVAQYASVIGRQFSFQLLREVSQLDKAILQQELGRLVDAELVYRRGVIPDATFTFKHALVQDIAYQSLLKSTRQQYHRQIAEVFETQFPDIVETQPELVAYHYTEAACFEPAVNYWQKACQVAQEHSANHEAMGHLTRAFEELDKMPQSTQKAQYELNLHINLGLVSRFIKGQSDPAVEQAYLHVAELSEQLQDSYAHFVARAALARFYGGHTDVSKVFENVERCVDIAEQTQEPDLLLDAYMLKGSSTFTYTFELADSRSYFEKGLAAYISEKDGALATSSGLDPGMLAQSRLSWILWLLGYPDQARQRSREALDIAESRQLSFTLTTALIHDAIFFTFVRDIPSMYKQALATVKLAREKGPVQRVYEGEILRNLALVMQGDTAGEVVQIVQGLRDLQTTGIELFRPWLLYLHANVYFQSGQIAEGIALMPEALDLADNREIWCAAEIHRFKGELFLHQPTPNAAQAEACFQHALDLSQRQQAKSWELRAATSLAKLWQSQEKRQDAYDLLAPVYGWFTEGFDTADLQDAKALLDELAN